MIVDASAIVAILRNEPEKEQFNEAIAKAESRRISAVNYVEAAAVIDAKLPSIMRDHCLMRSSARRARSCGIKFNNVRSPARRMLDSRPSTPHVRYT